MMNQRATRLLLWLLMAGCLVPSTIQAQIGGTGWSSKPPTFNVQWPYTVTQSSRYTVSNGVYHCLVFSNDPPFKAGSTTLPRTEQRFTPDYTNGEVQYQAMLKASADENSYCVFQIHTGDAQSAAFGSTTFMLFWFSSNGGSVHDYSGAELAHNLGDQWFQLNVDHNLATRLIKVWINSSLVWTQQDNGAGDFYMKDGVYMQNHSPTYQMDSWVTGIQFWTSSGTNPPAPPTGLSATNSSARIRLQWAPSADATMYHLKRATVQGGPYSLIATINGTNYTDNFVTNATMYYYVVSAVDGFGESLNSGEASASFGWGAPVLNAIHLDDSQILLTSSNLMPEQPYGLFAATNPSMPSVLWEPVFTNTVDASGSVRFTIPVTSSTARFFRLELSP